MRTDCDLRTTGVAAALGVKVTVVAAVSESKRQLR
jgi:hypothetical protein